MIALLVELVPFALGLAVTPAAIAAGVLFLGSKRPFTDDLAFTAPFVLVYALISAAVLVASGASSDPLVDDHGKGVAALVVGLLLLRPDRAGRGLERMRGWLGQHEHAVNVGVLAVFGVVFTLKGLVGL